MLLSGPGPNLALILIVAMAIAVITRLMTSPSRPAVQRHDDIKHL